MVTYMFFKYKFSIFSKKIKNNFLNLKYKMLFNKEKYFQLKLDKSGYFFENEKDELWQRYSLDPEVGIDFDDFLNHYIKRKYRKSFKKNIRDGDVIDVKNYRGTGMVTYQDGKLYQNIDEYGRYMHPYYIENLLINERREDIMLDIIPLGFILPKEMKFETILTTGKIIKYQNDNEYTYFQEEVEEYDISKIYLNIIDEVVFKYYTFSFSFDTLYIYEASSENDDSVRYYTTDFEDEEYLMDKEKMYENKDSFKYTEESMKQFKITSETILTHRYFKFDERKENFVYEVEDNIITTNEYMFTMYMIGIYDPDKLDLMIFKELEKLI